MPFERKTKKNMGLSTSKKVEVKKICEYEMDFKYPTGQEWRMDIVSKLKSPLFEMTTSKIEKIIEELFRKSMELNFFRSD